MYSASTFVSDALHIAAEPVSQQLYFPLFDRTLFFIETLSNNVRPWTLFDVEFLLTQKRRYCVEPPPFMADRCRIYLP